MKWKNPYITSIKKDIQGHIQIHNESSNLCAYVLLQCKTIRKFSAIFTNIFLLFHMRANINFIFTNFFIPYSNQKTIFIRILKFMFFSFSIQNKMKFLLMYEKKLIRRELKKTRIRKNIFVHENIILMYIQ